MQNYIFGNKIDIKKNKIEYLIFLKDYCLESSIQYLKA